MTEEEQTPAPAESTFPSFLKAQKYRKGFNKWVYDQLASLDSDAAEILAESNLTTAVNSLKSDVADLKERMTAAEEYIKSLNAKIDELSPEEEPAKYTISITVKNASSEPIEGATVTIGETDKTTGSAGGCTFSDIAAGDYSISVSANNYAEYTGSITVSEESTSFNIQMSTE